MNIDLLSVGVAVAATLILGFVVFFGKKNSSTSTFFLLFTIVSAGWSVCNYMSYQVSDISVRLWVIRFVLFFATFQAYTFFLLMKSFPRERIELSKRITFWLTIFVFIIAGLTLSSFIFSGIEAAPQGQVSQPIIAPGIILFASTAISLVLAGVSTLILKLKRADPQEKTQFKYLLIGVTLMFSLIIVFNFIFPATFQITRLIPFSAFFILPFVGFTTYGIFKHHLLGIKVLTTEILTFILAIVTFFEIILARDVGTIIFRSGTFLFVLSFGILLIKSVFREVEQREKLQTLTEELSTANVKLKELDRQKSEFLRVASHDLKSPIALMKQWASLIYDKTYTDPKQVDDTLVKIKTTADRAAQSVDDLLDVNKIDENRMDYTFEEKDIVSFVKGVTEDYAPLAKAQKNIEVSFKSQVASAKVKMDTTRFRQVIQNLLSNALKYTEAGWIKVTLTEEQKSILISVKDSGLGMGKELLPILFEQFRRDPSVAKKIQGTGLGLYISKKFVIAHGGEIWAESEGKGFGSSFFVRLPKI